MNTSYSREFAIQGMSCVMRVEKALRRVPGVEAASINLATELATVHAGPEVSDAELVQVVASAGFKANRQAARAKPAKPARAWPDGWPVAMAALGLLNPIVAGAAMAFSSVSLVSNSLLLKRWSPDNSQS
ncbi:MAG: heavy-metal-associated domain-containing protein [Gammaproteobacteria bacterium]|nr:heavy-metal-associated domain-containing protein [Gammaproteobacteria bacterium]